MEKPVTLFAQMNVACLAAVHRFMPSFAIRFEFFVPDALSGTFGVHVNVIMIHCIDYTEC
jgi:hypothetical protein